jgi:hypothetical protein
MSKLRENSERVNELEHAGEEIEKAKNRQNLVIFYKEWRLQFHQK